MMLPMRMPGAITSRAYGLGSTLGFPISENNSLNLGLDYVHNRLTNMDPELTTWRYLSSRGIEPSVVTKDGDSGAKYSANDYFVSLGWGYNDLDRGFFPRAGNKSSLSGKVTLPGSDNSYYKLSFDTAQYLPLSENKRWVWMERLRAGYAGGLGRQKVYRSTITFTPAARRQCAASLLTPLGLKRPITAAMVAKAAIAPARWTPHLMRSAGMPWRC